MQIKALRGARGDYGNVRRGAVIDVDDHQARQLVKRGLFVPVQGGAEAAKSASKRPSQPHPTGGRTGAEKALSSSREGPAPSKRRSKSSGDAPA